MAVRSKRKSQAWLVRIRDCSAKAFVLGVLGLAVILFPLALMPFAGMLGIADRYVTFVVLRNWSQFLMALIRAAVTSAVTAGTTFSWRLTVGTSVAGLTRMVVAVGS